MMGIRMSGPWVFALLFIPRRSSHQEPGPLRRSPLHSRDFLLRGRRCPTSAPRLLTLLGFLLVAQVATAVLGASPTVSQPMTGGLAPASAYGAPSDGISTSTQIAVLGQTAPRTKV